MPTSPDHMPLHGTVALVTGGAQRVGRAIARELAGAGCDLAVHYHQSHDQAEQLAMELRGVNRRCVLVQGDLNDPTTWPRIVDETVSSLGRLDILVNNASAFRTGHRDTLESFDLVEWEKMLRINLVAPIALCHHAAPHLKAHGRGNIVNLGDIAAARPGPNAIAYYSSKAGLGAATKSLARALAPEVRVNAVAPGIAAFPEDYTVEQRRNLVERVPLQREGTPEEVAAAVRFLVESGDYITGQTLAIDGGRNLV